MEAVWKRRGDLEEKENENRGGGMGEKICRAAGEDSHALQSFGPCAPAAALRLKVAQAAFSERALWVVRAGAERVS